jgi:hypothetical protein
VLTVTVNFFVWLFQINRELARSLGRGSAAGRLLLFLLVPVVGWFLAILFTGRSIRRVQVRAGNERLVQPALHAIWAGLVPVLGWFIAMGYLQRAANRAWLKMDSYFEPGSQQNARVECPDCDSIFVTLWNPVAPHAVRCPQCGRVGDV